MCCLQRGLHLQHGHSEDTGAEDAAPVASVLDEAVFRIVVISDQYDPRALRFWFSGTNSSYRCCFLVEADFIII